MAEIKKEYIKDFDIELIKPYENNAKKHDVDRIVKSIKEHGYIAPIVIDENNIILAGHGRRKALKKLKYKKVEVVKVSGLSEEDKRLYRLKDNRLVELGGYDFDILKDEFTIEELKDLEFDLDFDIDLGGGTTERLNRLEDKFLIPPFNIWDGKTAGWLNRKRIWKNLILENGQARKNVKVYNNEQTNDKIKYSKNGVMQNEVSILDPVMAELINIYFSEKGFKTFDCFAGDTIFGYVSSKLERNFTGIELRQEQVDFNNEKIKEFQQSKYICDDGQNILEHIKEDSQDLLFSCPPYFNLEVYSNLKNDASNQKNYEDFIKILDNAFTNSIKCLKDDRFAVIVVGDIRNKKTGYYYNFTNDIVQIFRKNNVDLYNNIKLLTPFGTAQIRASKYMKSRKLVNVYQDILVFFKGDSKKIQNIFSEVEYDKEDLLQNEEKDESTDI